MQSLFPNVVYNEGFSITASDTVDIENDPGNNIGVKQVFVHNRSAGGDVRVMPAAQRVYPTITLTGTAGTANININGTNYLATFGVSLSASAAAFVVTHAATLKNIGVIVSNPTGAVLRFVGANPSVFTITNASGDLAGTVLTPQPITIYIAQGGYSPFAVKRVYVTSPVPPANLTAVYSGSK